MSLMTFGISWFSSRKAGCCLVAGGLAMSRWWKIRVITSNVRGIQRRRSNQPLCRMAKRRDSYSHLFIVGLLDRNTLWKELF